MPITTTTNIVRSVAWVLAACSIEMFQAGSRLLTRRLGWIADPNSTIIAVTITVLARKQRHFPRFRIANARLMIASTLRMVVTVPTTVNPVTASTSRKAR